MQPLGLGVLEKYQVNIPGKVEELAWTLFDYQDYAAAGVASQRFFQTPEGQSGKTLGDTNMQFAGSIPAGQFFLIQSIEVDFQPLAANIGGASLYLDDVEAVALNGALQLNIGSKPYEKNAPLGAFPCSFRLAGFAAAAGAEAANEILTFAKNAGRIREIVPLGLVSTQNFDVTLTELPAVSVLSRIGVRLNGRLFRNAQ